MNHLQNLVLLRILVITIVSCGCDLDSSSDDELDTSLFTELVTFGNDEPFEAEITHDMNYLIGSEIEVTSDCLMVDFGVIAHSQGQSLMIVLYDDHGGHPDNLIVHSDPVTLNLDRNEVEVEPTLLTSGTYWIMAVYDSDAKIGFEIDGPVERHKYVEHTFGDPFPSTCHPAESFFTPRVNYYIGGYTY